MIEVLSCEYQILEASIDTCIGEPLFIDKKETLQSLFVQFLKGTTLTSSKDEFILDVSLTVYM